jgi:hypothetical protein
MPQEFHTVTAQHNKNRSERANAMTATKNNNEYDNDDKAMMIPQYAQTLATAGEASRLLQQPHLGRRRRRRRCHSASGGPLLLLQPDAAAVGTSSSSLQNVRAAVSKLFTESVAAHMHSVGVLGDDERLDETGTLHYCYYVSVQTTTRHSKKNAAAKERHFFNYGALHDLFRPEPLIRPRVATAEDDGQNYEGEGDVVGEELEEEEEEAEEIMDVVEGGSLSAAIFGIIKGTVGPAILYLPRGTYAWTHLISTAFFLTYHTYTYTYIITNQAFNKVDGPSLFPPCSSPRTCSFTMRIGYWNVGKSKVIRITPLPQI